MGIKRKKKKKFRKWQKNSGAIFEKGDANMGWWDNIKSGSKLDPAMERLKTTYEELISHPDYNKDEITGLNALSVINILEKGDFDIETLIDYIHEKDKEAGEKYGMPVRDKDEINPMTVANWLKWSENFLRKAFNKLGKERSLGLFESMAETMGVEIRYEGFGRDRTRPSFNHKGLNFKISGKNELVISAGRVKVTVCIVSSNPDLPIGDYYTTLLGLIVARPTELDVLDFSIKLANIFKEYNCPFELMHCNSSYPMPITDANLRKMIPL